ncbi:MAG TPA: amidase [Paracoccaceae bacterium]|nr:amidase [Paracoccaceae bacterium]
MSIADAYDSHDALGLAALVATGEVTPAELLEEALGRAEALNPKLNALTLMRPDTARGHVAAGLPDGPLKGVPFLLKDLGAEAVDFPSNSGSRLAAETTAPADSHFHERCRAAGLVTFGRTTSPEFGIGPATEAAVYGGPTRNPWNLERTSGGSSGGSGAAVAAGILPAAHASDGAGSIRIPAASCGLFGVKPTRGLMPNGPLKGEGWGGLATSGFVSRTVRDQAALLDATAGADLGAPYAAPELGGSFSDAIKAPPRRLRIGFLTTTLTGLPIHADNRAAVEAAMKTLEALGHRVEAAPLPDADTDGVTVGVANMIACGTAEGIRSLCAAKGIPLEEAPIESVARGALAVAEGISGGDAFVEIARLHAYGRDMARWMQPFDAIVTATLAEPPAEVGRFAHVTEDFMDYRLGPKGVYAYSPFTAAFNASGQPAASLPLFWNDHGLPIGVHVAMPFGRDLELMALSAELEQAMPWASRRPPVHAANLRT